MIANALLPMLGVAVLAAMQADENPAVLRSRATSAIVQAGEGTWTIRSRESADGLDVRWQSGDTVEEFQVDFGGAVGRVIDVAAAFRQYKHDRAIALAIASQKSPQDRIEYRLAWARGTGALSDPALWLCGEPVQTVGADQPYHLLSVAIPMGDSVIITMQRLTRVSGSENKIETYVVINHCPVGSENKLLKMHSPHYSSVMTEPVEAQPAQGAAKSESGKNAEEK